MDKNYKKPDASRSNVVQPIHNNLLELVQKNKTIPAFLNNLTANEPRLGCLKKAIRKGNFRAKIWKITHYLIPSSSLINYVLQALNQQPLRMRPVFGNPARNFVSMA